MAPLTEVDADVELEVVAVVVVETVVVLAVRSARNVVLRTALDVSALGGGGNPARRSSSSVIKVVWSPCADEEPSRSSCDESDPELFGLLFCGHTTGVDGRTLALQRKHSPVP